MNDKPGSSQTALIDEYRVLWTTQKKQKLKKWHDGFLRFHKFNKRVLVYDDARHLVADMYLRGKDAIVEGDDLEFEHHLVTIEDFKGTVIQDLAPLFSPAAQRKQQIQAGNALLNSPTPNQANRHGPWGPSRHATPTPQSVQQRQSMAAARPPETPVQRRPMNTDMNLQSIRPNSNHLPSAQNRLARPVQQHFPPSALVSIPKIGDPPPRSNSAPRSNPQPKAHPLPRSGPPQRPNLQSGSIQEQGLSWSNPASIAQPSRRLPFHAPGGSLSPNKRPKPPPPTTLQRTRPPCPCPNNAPLRPSSPHANQGPSVASPDSNSYFDSIRPSFDIQSPTSPHEPPPPGQSNSDFPRPVPSLENEYNSGALFDLESDSEIFGSPPDFQVSTPLSRPSNISTGLVPIRAKKRLLEAPSTDSDPRAFRPPSRRKTTTLPGMPQPRSSRVPGLLLSQDSDVVSDLGEDNGKDPVFEPLVSAGILQLGNAIKRKRNKLLCQRPPNFHATAKTPLVSSTRGQSAKKNLVKEPKVASLPKPPSPGITGKVIVIGDDTTEHTRVGPSAVKRREKGSVSRGSKGAAKSTEGWEINKGKGKASDPGVRQDHRIEEKEDSIEYQEEHDIGPWSSEAFDLFGWRPPNMKDRK